MTSQNAAFASPDFRFHLVNDPVPGNNTGVTLLELSVAGLPEGSIAYVRRNNAFYSYKPRSVAAPDTTDYRNVVKASGPGNWVRQTQVARATLAAGAATITGHFDLSGLGDFSISQAGAPSGTQGFRYAIKTSDSVATVTSASNTDTSTVVVSYTETSSA